MKVSVIMTTYNGEKYIVDQLKSILNQSRHADEVLVFDDVSNDNTVSLINDFIADNNLSNWKLYVNKENLGWKRNFMQGILSASGDVFFLSDQDDLWHPKKIEIMADVFSKENGANLVVCNYLRFGTSDSNKLSNKCVELGYHIQNNRLKNWNIPYPGCTYAIKKEFFYHIKDLWMDGMAHDYFIYEAAWLSNSIFVCDSILHFFRRHNESATTKSPVLFDKNLRLNSIVKKIQLIDSFMFFDKIFDCREGAMLKKWLELRKDLIEKGSFRTVLKLLSLFHLYNNFKTFFTDCFVALKSK